MTWVGGISDIADEQNDDSDIEAPPFSPLSQQEDDALEENSSDEFDVQDECENIVLLSDLQQQPEDVQSTMASSWSGFKIVGDNVDYNIHASFQRSDDTAQRSFHQFHAIAVKDRVDFSALSDSAPVLSSADYDLKSLLPSEADIDIIKDEMSILISR